MNTEPTIGEIFQLDVEPVKSVRVPEPGREGINRRHLLLLIGLTALMAVGMAAGIGNQHQSATASACQSDWSKCTNNVEMARNYEGWTEAEVKCKIAANKLAKYGTPEWPWLAFQNLASGTDYAENGEATLIENNAKFQNEYGAMVHTRVGCDYNLRTKKVEYVHPVDLPYNIYYKEKEMPK